MSRFYASIGWEILTKPALADDTTWRWTMHPPHG